MTRLEKWLPFRTARRTEQERRGEPRGGAWPLAAPMGHMLRSVMEDPFFREAFGRWEDVDRWFGDFAPTRYWPSVDVVDEENAIRVTAELPGMGKDDVQLTVDNGLLTIRGEKKNVEEMRESGVYRAERYYGAFHRTMPLPADVDPEKADAQFDNGILTVRFPKKPQAREASKGIPIR